MLALGDFSHSLILACWNYEIVYWIHGQKRSRRQWWWCQRWLV